MLKRGFLLLTIAASVIMLPLRASAQTYFDFGSTSFVPRAHVPVVVFWATPSFQYRVATTVKDMVFDHTKEYSTQLMQKTFTTKDLSLKTGFYHVNRTGLTPQSQIGDVEDKFNELLGCGTYHFALLNLNNDEFIAFDLDLTDASWAVDPGDEFRNILIVPEYDNSLASWFVHIWISTPSRLSTQMIDCGLYNNGDRITYWELIRQQGGTWSSYERDRTGFKITPGLATPDGAGTANPSTLPFNPNVQGQTLVVDVLVSDNVTVPSGNTFTVGTEPNPLPYSNQETIVEFAAGKGITVEGGGTLISMSTGPSGLVTWQGYQNTNRGCWPGIAAELGSTIDFRVTHVKNAVKGIVLDHVSSATFEGCIFERSSDFGMEVIDCSPSVTLCEMSYTGELGGSTHTANLYIWGNDAEPTFERTVVSDAVRSSAAEYLTTGLGVEITGTSKAASFTECLLQENESYGIYIHETHGPRILQSSVDFNGASGGFATGGIGIYGGTFWTTLQQSFVRYNSGPGIRLVGTSDAQAKLRGWWHPDDLVTPANGSTDVDAVMSMAPNGENCISNNSRSIFSESGGVVDLGVPYLDSQANMQILGGHNSICRPAMVQVESQNYSTANLEANWWENDYSIFPDGTSTADYTNEITSDEVYCVSDRKAIASRSTSLVRDMFEMRRAQWREKKQAEATPEATPAPMSAMLSAAFPNPFNPTVQLTVAVALKQDIHLAVFDTQGRQLAVLANGSYDFGSYTFTYDATSLPSGTYYAVLQTAQGVETRALTLVK